MAYSKNTWADGDVITSAKMNNIESGIESASTQIEAISGDIEDIETQIETATSDISDVTAKANTNEGMIQSLNSALAVVWSRIYPVGSIYMSVNSTDPGTLFGGTWVQIKDTFLLSAGDTYSAGITGGTTTHTHMYGVKWASNWGLPASDEGMIQIMKSDGAYQEGTQGGTDTFDVNDGATATRSVSAKWFTNEANVSEAPHMPPYLAVYVWKRTQ